MNDSAYNTQGIAIIGMAGKFPGAPDLDTFWQNIAAGRDTITRFSRAELEARNQAALEFGPDYVAAHGVLENAEMFDAEFFGISPRDADYLDPQHRLFLETCWTALEDGGYDPPAFAGQIGLFGGCSLNTYLLANLCGSRDFLNELTGNYQVGEFQATLGNDKDFLCSRVAYKLNLRGPCMTVQGACATSLVAVVQACQNLLTYQCDMALAGGVSITFPQFRGYVYQEGSMGSRDGHCRPFDADATGTVFGHGAGVVLLKRLEDALADGDRIDAVIRGFSVNNDGSAKVGYMAPGVDGQTAVIAAAQAMAGIRAEDVSYVEAHGTATPLGDPIEVAGLTAAFRRSTQKNGFCALGSTKANIGHLDAAAGVSGLIKIVLAMRHGIIPPVANFKRPNPNIDFAGTPFYVNPDSIPWNPEGPRVAGVSAFGVGGVNAHLVLEEAPSGAVASEPSSRTAQLVCVSARSDAALDEALMNLGKNLQDNSRNVDLADVSFTLLTGRHGFNHRAAAVFSTADEAAQVLSELRSTKIHRSSSVITPPQAAFLFTGQGAQFPGMGQALYQSEPIYRAEVDACAEILRAPLELDLRSLLFPTDINRETIAETLTDTRYAQPALFVTELAMAALWKHWGIVPKAMAGHSLGEFTAAVIAGVMSREDALRLVAVRGRLMQQMERGAMLSVRLPEEALANFLDPRLSIAALNSPSLSVASGPIDVIDELKKQLEGDSIACKLLRTSHAFHSAMMDPMLDAFEKEVRRTTLHPPAVPYVSGVTGRWIMSSEATDPKYWTDHCRKPVRFADAAALLLELPGAVLLEVGPGQSLATLALQQRGSRPVPVVASMPDRAADGITGSMQEALGRLWSAGVQPDWARYFDRERRKRVSLPTYPFERKKHWIEAPAPVVPSQQQLLSTPASTTIPLERKTPMLPTFSEPVQERRLRLQPMVANLFEELSGIAVAPEAFDASFMDLGFDSLFLTQVTQALQRRFGVKVTFRQIVEQYSTIRAVAERLDAQMPVDKFPAEQATQPASAVPTDFPTQSAPASNSAIEDLIQAQMRAMTEMFEQQLAALRGATSHPLTPQAPLQAAPPAQLPPAAQAAHAALPSAEIKAHGPFKPVQPGNKDGVTEQQREYVRSLIDRYNKRTGRSKEYTQKHRTHLADPRAVAGFRSLWKEMVYPIVAERSKGSRLWDLDGNEYIDIVNGFGAIMFGHGPDFVTEAVHKQIERGVEIGPQSALTGDVAAMICDLTGMERAAFCNTGSEAVMAAMRVARTVTAREKVVYFTGDYHGTFDEVLLRAIPNGATPIAPGIPAGAASNIIVLDYGAATSLEYIRTHAEDIAAVLVEPIQSRHPDVQPREFLHQLRSITEQAGVALIFDEVVTGFRVALGGAQEYFGVRADLATYGKVIGGGYPIGVLAGKAEYLDALDGGAWQYGDDSAPEAGMTFFAGTFVRHPLALAAAKAVLLHLKQAGPALQDNLRRKVAETAHEVENCFREVGMNTHVTACGAWFTFSLPSDARFGSLLYCHMREKGVHILESYPCFFTTAHSDEDFARVVEVFGESLQEMREAGMLPASVDEPASLQSPLSNLQSDSVQTAPLTESQREILLAAARGDEVNCAFNESLTLTLRGDARESEILDALLAAINRHDALRSTIDPNGDLLHIAPTYTGQIPFVDLSAITAEERSAFLEQRIAEEARTPFDLMHGPLLRALLFRTKPDELLLLLTGHHIVLDGWSSNQLLEDMGKLYSAAKTHTAPSLAQLMPFSKYALREQAENQAGAYAENEQYWVDAFAGRAPVLDLPTDRPRPPMKTFSGDTFHSSLGSELTAGLRKASRSLGCTLYVTLLSSFELLLHHLTRQAEVVVGISAAGQALLDDASLVGHCVHFLPMLSELQDGMTIHDHLLATRRQLLDAYDHQEFTYGTLLRKLSIPRDPSRLPLIEVQFNLEKLGTNLHFEGLHTEMQANPKRFVNTDIFLNVVEAGDDLLLNCDFNTELIDRTTLERWMNTYAMILKGVVADATQQISDLEIVDPSERKRVIEDWNRTEADFGEFESICSAFERQAEQNPNRSATVCEDAEWTYRQLNEYSNRVARYLRKQGVREGSVVAVCLDRSNEMLGAVLGVMKAGAAYLPLDPKHPAERLELVLADAGATLLLSEERIASTLRTDSRISCLDTEQRLLNKESGANLDIKATPDTLAYVIYTSGSTGKPKGVAIEHGALTNLLRSMEQTPGLNASDTLVSVTTLSFDIAALELFLPLMAGARLVIATAEQARDGFGLLRLLEHSRATVMQATPVGWRILLEAGWQGQPDLKVLCGGEALPADLAETLCSYSRNVWNMYGPTETTIWSSATRVGAGPVRLGPPIANTQFYVLNEKLRPVPIGVTGELCIGGSGLARSYWHRDELTSEKFVPNPSAAGRIYRTGDLARWRPDGTIELLGRTDYQVKVRGYRIELGEIETTLASHPAVRDVVVLAIDAGTGEKQLAAWVDSDLQPPPGDLAATLRALLAAKVPEYMVPSTISVLSILPRTPNGKIDRKNLPSPEMPKSSSPRTYTPPETPQQKKLAKIWADVLKLDQVSITDSIFELGADSLMIFRISARAKKEGLVIQPAQIFQMRTIADLVGALDKDRVGDLEPLVLGSTILPVSRDKYRRTGS